MSAKPTRKDRLRDRAKRCRTCGKRFASRPALMRHAAAHDLSERSGLNVEDGARALKHLEDAHVIEVNGRRGLRLTSEFARYREAKARLEREAGDG
jgi:hypothetical protein